MLLRTALFAPLMALSVIGGAHAVVILSATLTNSQEVPPTTPTTSTGAPRPASFGTASFVLNDAMVRAREIVVLVGRLEPREVDVEDRRIERHRRHRVVQYETCRTEGSRPGRSGGGGGGRRRDLLRIGQGRR